MTKRMKKIGYIYEHVSDPYDEDNIIIRSLKKKFEIVPIRTNDIYALENLPDLVKECRFVLNFSPSMLGLELAKEIEQLKIKVINPSPTYYMNEDKWMFYLHCKKHKIPTPETIIVSNNRQAAKQEISDFLKSGPIVLKTIFGERGEFVLRAMNTRQALKIIEHFSRKTTAPIIAQKFVEDYGRTYRITVFGNKVVQRIIKIGKNWKVKGYGRETMRLIKQNKTLDAISLNVAKVVKQEICGIDFIENNNKFFVLEANGVPSLSLIKKDMDRLTKELSAYLEKKLKLSLNINKKNI